MSRPADARPRRWSRRADERGDVLAVAILFVGLLITILIGVHVVVVAMARGAVQGAADASVRAAQSATDCVTTGTLDCREYAGAVAARRAIDAAGGHVFMTRDPAVSVEEERGTVSVFVVGRTISPILGSIELAASSCGPLDNLSAHEITAADAWEC